MAVGYCIELFANCQWKTNFAGITVHLLTTDRLIALDAMVPLQQMQPFYTLNLHKTKDSALKHHTGHSGPCNTGFAKKLAIQMHQISPVRYLLNGEDAIHTARMHIDVVGSWLAAVSGATTLGTAT